MASDIASTFTAAPPVASDVASTSTAAAAVVQRNNTSVQEIEEVVEPPQTVLQPPRAPVCHSFSPDHIYYHRSFSADPVYYRRPLFRKSGRCQRWCEERSGDIRLIVVIFLAILAIGFSIAAVWFMFRAVRPQLALLSVDMSPISITGTAITHVTCELSFVFVNSNRGPLVYDQTEVTLFYKVEEMPLSTTYLDPFFQPKTSKTILSASLHVRYADLGGTLMESLKSELSSGSVNFGFKVAGLVRFPKGSWTTKVKLMTSYCDAANVSFPDLIGSGELPFYSRCRVSLSKA